MIEQIKDRWLTWRTGKTKDEREWAAWCDTNIVYRAGTIKNRFKHFKHIITVDPNKFFDLSEPFGWVPCASAKKYLYPTRELGNNAVYCFERVIWDKWSNDWMLNDLGDEDIVFVATNNDRDATMIALKYMS